MLHISETILTSAFNESINHSAIQYTANSIILNPDYAAEEELNMVPSTILTQSWVHILQLNTQQRRVYLFPQPRSVSATYV